MARSASDSEVLAEPMRCILEVMKDNQHTVRVAIVHDWLYGGGAERVVAELHRLYPDAPIYTAYCSSEWRRKLHGKVVTGYLQHFGMLRKFLPLLQYWWFRSLKLDNFDIVISSAGNGMAKAVRVPKHVKHISYCHTPVHYLWRHYDRYMQEPGFGPFNGLARFGLAVLAAPLRKMDYAAAQRVDVFVANSTHIQQDIKRYYGRGSVVVFPPVDLDRFKGNTKVRRHGYVAMSRLVPMKRFDIVVEACTRLNLPLTVIGKGPEKSRLKAMAGPTVKFLGRASDQAVATELAKAQAMLFASFEDFGITPVEAMAAGTPVIAYKAGGALDYIEPGVTGEFFPVQSVDSLGEALQVFDASKYKPAVIKERASRFSVKHFRAGIQKIVAQATKG